MVLDSYSQLQNYHQVITKYYFPAAFGSFLADFYMFRNELDFTVHFYSESVPETLRSSAMEAHNSE